MADKHPTILQIIPELDTGGAELSTIEIADAIVQAGGRAIVLSEGGRLVQKLRETGGEIRFFAAASKNPFRIIWNARKIARLIARENVDLVHARSRAPAWSAFLAARHMKIPFVTTYHGAYSEKGKLKKFYNSVMARADVVIANSRYTADLIQGRYNTPEDRIEVIYRGVEGGVFDPGNIDPKRVAELRSQWGVKAGERVVLHPARLSGWKGQRIVVTAARLLRRQGRLRNAVVILAGAAQGRSAYVASLQQAIDDAGLEDVVRLVGHVDDIPAALLASHVAIVASTEPEAFGRTATEAQVMGTPVIATNIGAPPETVLAPPKVSANTMTGWLVPPAEPSRLADAIAAALAISPEDRKRMGARARTHVLQAFSLKAMKHNTLRVYDRLLGTHLAGDEH